MNTWLTLIFLTTMIMVIPTKSAITCIKNAKECIRSSECCTGCCHNNKCVNNDESCLGELEKIGAGNGALCSRKCRVGQTCQLQQVQCIRAPCPPIATCVSDDYKDYDN